MKNYLSIGYISMISDIWHVFVKYNVKFIFTDYCFDVTICLNMDLLNVNYLTMIR